jgi:hypothetical protein
MAGLFEEEGHVVCDSVQSARRDYVATRAEADFVEFSAPAASINFREL